MDTEREGEGGTNWECKIYTLPYITVYKIASGELLYSTGSACSVLWDDQGDGGEEGVRAGGPREREYVYTYCVYILIHFTVHQKHNIVKQLYSNKK